jgi:hypothetical protein
MIVFDYILSNNRNIIQFYNLSGLCELRINKKHIENKTYDECVYYVRRKLKDISITAIKNFNLDVLYNDVLYNDVSYNDVSYNDVSYNDVSYNNIIIRNIYREKIWRFYSDSDDNYDRYVESTKCGKCDESSSQGDFCNWCVVDPENLLWNLDNRILFDDKEIILAVLAGKAQFEDSQYLYYTSISERFKYDKDICGMIVKTNTFMYKYFPDEIKNDIDFIMSLDNKTIYYISDYLPHHIKNNTIISEIINTYRMYILLGGGLAKCRYVP